MGFVLFNQNTNNDDKNIETNFIFAHEVAAGYYGDTYHDYGEDEDYMTISSTWKRNYFRQLSDTKNVSISSISFVNMNNVQIKAMYQS